MLRNNIPALRARHEPKIVQEDSPIDLVDKLPDIALDIIVGEFERFEPEFLLISCGFDAHADDPLGAQRLESDTFGEMTRRVRHVAEGRIVSILEGGYNIDALAASTLAHLRALQA